MIRDIFVQGGDAKNLLYEPVESRPKYFQDFFCEDANLPLSELEYFAFFIS